jgi:hypothetical protein
MRYHLLDLAAGVNATIRRREMLMSGGSEVDPMMALTVFDLAVHALTLACCCTFLRFRHDVGSHALYIF